MLDNTNWYRRHEGLDRFISWLGSQREDTYDWDDCANCLFARYARTLGVRLGQAWNSLHPDGSTAMELYYHIGGGDNGGRQSYVDALARAQYWQERPMLLDIVNLDGVSPCADALPTSSLGRRSSNSIG
jgi:hypothetical protein